MSERPEYQRPLKPVAWENGSSMVSTVSSELSCIDSQPIQSGWLAFLFLSQVRGQTLRNVAQVVGCNNTIPYTAVHTSISVNTGPMETRLYPIQQSISLSQLIQDPMETRQQSLRPPDKLVGAGSQPAPVPAEQQVFVKYAMWGAEDMLHPFCRSWSVESRNWRSPKMVKMSRAPFSFFADESEHMSRLECPNRLRPVPPQKSLGRTKLQHLICLQTEQCLLLS